MEHYLNGYKQFLENTSKSPHTIKQYVLDAKHFIHFWTQHAENDFSSILSHFRNDLMVNYHNSNSINRKLAGTHKFVRFLYDRAYISSYNETIFEPIDKTIVDLIHLSNNEIATIYQSLNKLIEIADEPEHEFLAKRHLALFTIFITTGIKPIECVKMKWVHVQEERLIIPQKLQPRIIPMPRQVYETLIELKDVSEVIFGEQPYVWLGIGNKKGDSITEKTIERFFMMLSEMVNFKVTATMCRYTVIDAQQKNDIFAQIGYSRKDVLTERLKKLNNHK